MLAFEHIIKLENIKIRCLNVKMFLKKGKCKNQCLNFD